MLKVRKAKIGDLDSIVRIHLERFSSFFLTSLGASFLKVFYAAFIKGQEVLLVLENDGEVKGFAAGSRLNKGFFRKLLFSNFLEFIIQGIIIVFTKPKALIRIIKKATKAEKNNVEFAELLSIATEINKNGYGKILLHEFEQEIFTKNNNIFPISLTTDYINNEKTVEFYLHSGYEVLEVFESYQNRKMYRFIKYNSK